MQAILKAPLYKRPQPTNEVQAMGYLPAGSVIDIESIVKGKSIDGSDNWIKAADGFHYWADDAVISKVPISFDSTKMSWGHQTLDIPGIWARMGTFGKGAVVAVIDSGIVTSNKDLSPNIHPQSKSFVQNVSSIADTDDHFHGTNMAGIIGATGKNIVYGVAPEAQLLIVKASKTTLDFDIKSFTEAFNYLADISDVDIISISYCFVDNDPDFLKAVQKCLDAGKIIVASIGDMRSKHPAIVVDPDRYPSAFNTFNAGFIAQKGVLGIGSFDVNKALCGFSAWNSHLSCLAPGDLNILTTGNSEAAVAGSQTSIASAFTAGCLALMVSYGKLKGSAPDYINALLGSCDSQDGSSQFSNKSGYGRINLKNAFSKI